MSNGYKAFWRGKTMDLRAGTLLQAKLQAIAEWRVPRKQEHMVSVVLCELGSETVAHSPAEFG